MSMKLIGFDEVATVDNALFKELGEKKHPFSEPEAHGGARRFHVVDDTVTLNRHQRRRLLAKKRKAKNKKGK